MRARAFYNSLNTVAGLVAGGGGGGSFSNDNVGGGGDCNNVQGTTNQCRLGGYGGGASGSADTVRALDESSNCGGRGGNNTPSGNDPPSVAGDCDDGGTDPTGTFGGAGTTGPLGGGAAFAVLRGGRGIDSDEADGDGNNGAPGGGGGGGEAGGYDDESNDTGYGGGSGSGTADAGVVNVSGEVAVLGFFDDTLTGDLNNNDVIIDDISSDPAAADWEVGMFISANNIPAGTTIVSIDSATQITVSQQSGSNANDTSLTVTSASSAGGSSDPDYSPSYLSSTPALENPGTGGTTDANVDGRGGAVVLKW